MSTPAPTTPAPTTCPDPENGLAVESSVVYKAATQTLVVRAWMENLHKTTVRTALSPVRCRCTVRDERGYVVMSKVAAADPAGGQFVRFEVPAVTLSGQHDYVMDVELYGEHCDVRAWGRFPLPTVN